VYDEGWNWREPTDAMSLRHADTSLPDLLGRRSFRYADTSLPDLLGRRRLRYTAQLPYYSWFFIIFGYRIFFHFFNIVAQEFYLK